MRHAGCAPVITSDSKSLCPAILDSTAFMFVYHSHSKRRNVAALIVFPKWCRSQDLEIPQDRSDGEGERGDEAPCSVGGGHAFFAEYSTRMLKTEN